MFEKYIESARRALFFARYEVSQLGATSIETEHVLLGLIRESTGPVARVLALSQVSLGDIRREIEGRSVFQQRLSTSVEVPFSAETQRVLGYAAEEADRLLHSYIGTEHLLLALLREEASVAGSILKMHGVRSEDARMTIVKLLAEPSTASISSPHPEVSEQIEHIKLLVQELAGTPPGSSQARELVERLGLKLDALKRDFVG